MSRRVSESVEGAAWREVVRLRADWLAVENALTCDAHKPEIKAAMSALRRLSMQAARVEGALRSAKPLPEPE